MSKFSVLNKSAKNNLGLEIIMPGKIAVVTGAGGGMGRAICLKLVQDGLTVVGLDLSAESLKETSTSIGDDFHSLTVDLTDSTAVAQAFANIKSQLGGVGCIGQ